MRMPQTAVCLRDKQAAVDTTHKRLFMWQTKGCDRRQHQAVTAPLLFIQPICALQPLFSYICSVMLIRYEENISDHSYPLLSERLALRESLPLLLFLTENGRRPVATVRIKDISG